MTSRFTVCRTTLAILLAATMGPAVLTTSALSYPADVIRKCRGDYNRLCPGQKVNSPSLNACMRSKHPLITTTCINALVDNGLAPPIARR